MNPTFVDMMLYSYCYAGLLTGTRIEMNIYTLGLTYNEFGYYEHPAIKNIFSLTKEHFWLTSIKVPLQWVPPLIWTCYNEHYDEHYTHCIWQLTGIIVHFCWPPCFFKANISLPGPYYKFRVYMDMINTDSSKIDTWTPMVRRLSWIPLISIGFLFMSHYFSVWVSFLLHKIESHKMSVWRLLFKITVIKLNLLLT